MLYSVDFYKRFGLPDVKFQQNEMVRYEVPKWARKAMPALPKAIFMNKQMVVPLETAFYNLIDRKLTGELKTWDGCFYVRAIRGYEKEYKKYMDAGQFLLAAKFMSVHSWGCAIDVNKDENGLGMEPKLSAGFVKCFTDAGFIWGGEFKRKDGMHFQLAYLTD